MDASTPAIGFTRTNGNQTSIDNQQALLTAWAARTSHTITTWTSSLDEALNLVKAGPAVVVVATDLERFSRDATVMLDWLDKLKAAGGRAETLDGPVGHDVRDTVLRLAAGLDEVNEQAGKAREAIYIHRSTAAARPATKQQQAAESWLAARQLVAEPPRP